jgi:enoyl-CoA hydratase/carnithine racemase
MDAQKAYEYGLANKVVPLEELDNTAMEMAKKISGNSALALMLTKTAVNRSLGMSLEETLVMESRDIQVIVGSAEQKQRSKEAMGRIKAKKKS